MCGATLQSALESKQAKIHWLQDGSQVLYHMFRRSAETNRDRPPLEASKGGEQGVREAPGPSV